MEYCYNCGEYVLPIGNSCPECGGYIDSLWDDDDYSNEDSGYYGDED